MKRWDETQYAREAAVLSGDLKGIDKSGISQKGEKVLTFIWPKLNSSNVALILTLFEVAFVGKSFLSLVNSTTVNIFLLELIESFYHSVLFLVFNSGTVSSPVWNRRFFRLPKKIFD